MRKIIVYLIILVFLFAPIALVVASFQSAPSLPQTAALSPKQAVKSKQVLKRIREAARSSQKPRAFTATQGDLDAIIAAAGRIARPLRGTTLIDESGVHIALAGQVPNLPQLGWVNFELLVAPSNDGLSVQKIRLGRISFPPELTVKSIILAMDLATSEDVGSILFGLVGSVSTKPGRVQVTFRDGDGGGGNLVDRVMSGVRNTLGISDPSRIQEQYDAFTQAVRNGELPNSGSVAPWISYALQLGHPLEDDAPAERKAKLNAALLALAAHCGDAKAINTIAGNITGKQGDALCKGLKLSDRIDLKKHFILSAALQVAGGSATSFGMGELKELIDAGADGGSGFSFDDIAADRAGIRFAETAATVDPEAFERLVELASMEENFMPSIAGLDSFMSEAEFLTRFGGVDGSAYIQKIADIDARIDALPLYSED